MYVGHIPSGSALPTGVSQFSVMDGVREYTTTSAAANGGLEVAWLPLTRQSSMTGSDSAMYITGLGWRDCDYDVCQDSAVCVIFVGALLASDWDSLQLRISHHWNFIPYNAMQPLFPADLPVGSQSTIDNVAAAAEYTVANSGRDVLSPGTWKAAIDGIVSGDAGGTGSMALDFASKGGKYLSKQGGKLGKVGDFIGKVSDGVMKVKGWVNSFSSIFGAPPPVERRMFELHRNSYFLFGSQVGRTMSPYKNRSIGALFLTLWYAHYGATLDEMQLMAWYSDCLQTMRSAGSVSSLEEMLRRELSCSGIELPSVDYNRDEFGLPLPYSRRGSKPLRKPVPSGNDARSPTVRLPSSDSKTTTPVVPLSHSSAVSIKPQRPASVQVVRGPRSSSEVPRLKVQEVSEDGVVVSPQ